MNVPDQVRELAELMTKIPSEVSVTKGRTDIPFLTERLDEILGQMAARRQLFLPNLQAHNDTVLVLSDYGGESPDSNYLVYSFLVCSYKPLAAFQRIQGELRSEHSLNNPVKEFAFKSMGYGPQDRALEGYLRNLDQLVPGIVFSVVIEKGLSLWGVDQKADRSELADILSELGLGTWKGPVAEKLVTVVHLVAYFAGLLVDEGQNLCWITDHDAIVANVEKTQNVGKLLHFTLEKYTTKELGKVMYGKSFGKDETLFLDLLSCPDIVAGTLEHYLTRDDKMDELTIKEPTNKVLRWHSYQGIGMKKYAFIFRKGEKGTILSGTLHIHNNEEPENFVPINIRP